MITTPEMLRRSDRTAPARRLSHSLALLALTICTLLIHGYHPFAEDGGLYVAGIESVLDPSLFPHDRAFATATLHYSLFAPVMATIVRILHIPLPWLLLIAYVIATTLFLVAAWRIAAQCFRSPTAQFYAVALIAAWFTLPVAGTSLLLMDPYVTARTFSTPLSLLAISFALSLGRKPVKKQLLSAFACLSCLFGAALFHPLMAAYAVAFIIAVLVARAPSRRARLTGWISLGIAAIIVAAALQIAAPVESVAMTASAFSRYYWFLSQWKWYEWLGLTGPLIVFSLVLHFALRKPHADRSIPRVELCRASMALGTISTIVSVLFAQQRFGTHPVARLQPLRGFLLLYAVMIILLGGTLAEKCFDTRRGPKRRSFFRAFPASFIVAMMLIMAFAERQTFPASQRLEVPWRPPLNPWQQAFVWARENTAPNALFALDADYITVPREDAQNFRAIAQRSMIPDFSKDGGAAAINPRLAESWLAGMTLQRDLSILDDSTRRARLAPLQVDWIVLRSSAPTANPCPYDNRIVKICKR